MKTIKEEWIEKFEIVVTDAIYDYDANLKDLVSRCFEIAKQYATSLQDKNRPIINKTFKCQCNNEIKTGQTSVMCCNICGKPDEDFWNSTSIQESKVSDEEIEKY